MLGSLVSTSIFDTTVNLLHWTRSGLPDNLVQNMLVASSFFSYVHKCSKKGLSSSVK